ncbi:hypothetical protein BX666DRAFT_337452 [Dichotomocladium elegans]|nr:hypothetical protein BX666DRAFT_337452 [Dichotomocladium elegans]
MGSAMSLTVSTIFALFHMGMRMGYFFGSLTAAFARKVECNWIQALANQIDWLCPTAAATQRLYLFLLHVEKYTPLTMRPGQQKQIQRPLQNEIAMLHKLLAGVCIDILEQAARILDHFAIMESSKLERGSLNPPSHLSAKLLEKCDQFETVCDQVYYILEQSKRHMLHDGVQGVGSREDMGTDLSLAQVDLAMDDASQLMDDVQRDGVDGQQGIDSMLVDEDDMDEMLQMQRERLERLRSVVVQGVDVEAIKASQSQANCFQAVLNPSLYTFTLKVTKRPLLPHTVFNLSSSQYPCSISLRSKNPG